MSVRLHPLAGLMVLLVGIGVYVVAAISLIDMLLPGGAAWTLVAYALAGIAWVPIAALLLRAIRHRS